MRRDHARDGFCHPRDRPAGRAVPSCRPSTRLHPRYEPGKRRRRGHHAWTASLVRGVVTALRALDARILVAGTIHDLSDLSDLDGDQVMVAGVLPSHLVMPRVDLAVTTGGQGSVQTAMAGGTPLLGIPLHIEQDLNVALAERLGAGRRLAPRSAITPQVAAVAADLLADGTYLERAGAIQRIYADVDGPGNAADAIATLAA